jgi:hypothetical protein
LPPAGAPADRAFGANPGQRHINPIFYCSRHLIQSVDCDVARPACDGGASRSSGLKTKKLFNAFAALFNPINDPGPPTSRKGNFMKANQLATLVLRLMGIYCFIPALPIIGTLTSLLFLALKRGEAFSGDLDATAMASFLLPAFGYMLAGILLLIFSTPMSKMLAGQSSGDESVAGCSMENIEILAFGVAGVLIFASTLPQLFSFPRYLLHMWGMGDSTLGRMRESLLGVAFKAGLGLWMFFGARGFARLWRSSRTFGTPKPPPGN